MGPGLIEGRQVDIDSEEPIKQSGYEAIRAFVGVCGKLTLLGYTKKPSHLYPIAKNISEAYGCTELANLSGGSEAFLAFRDPDNKSKFVRHGNMKTARASMVGFHIIEE
ncbi:MAG: hypothetical protein ABGY96_18270 [bacterium]|nr:hypothetical protein [Gammaproteobacteria bacterium]